MSVNKVILIGRLGKDPETRYMTSGEAVTNCTLATSETWKDKSGEKQEKTEWHNLVFYRRLAEIRRRIPEKGLADIRRRKTADTQVAGQGGQGPLHDRDRGQRNDNAGWQIVRCRQLRGGGEQARRGIQRHSSQVRAGQKQFR